MNIELLKEVKTAEETASIVYEILKSNGIDVVLTGGSCMEIYTHSNYSSYDLDFIANPSIKSEQIKNAMIQAGFKKTKNRYFKHPYNDYYVEFPTGPVSLGNEEPIVHNELIKSYLKSKEEKHKVDISIESDFLLLTDDLIDDYVIHQLLNVELGENKMYYNKMKNLYDDYYLSLEVEKALNDGEKSIKVKLDDL